MRRGKLSPPASDFGRDSENSFGCVFRNLTKQGKNKFEFIVNHYFSPKRKYGKGDRRQQRGDRSKESGVRRRTKKACTERRLEAERRSQETGVRSQQAGVGFTLPGA